MTLRLIVSFIGHADLRLTKVEGRATPRPEDENSPILRLLIHLAENGLCNPADTQLMLFDDTPSHDVRTEFCKGLPNILREIGLAGLPVERRDIELPNGPTDLNALYHGVWKSIPSGESRPDEVVFNLSSGTPAMHVTLLLAANCLPLDKVRLYESSSKSGVVEVEPPYVIAAREAQRDRARRHPTLSKDARKTLITDTVIDDPQVGLAYAALYKAAMRNRSAAGSPAVLIEGPTGCGKWHAARQFAAWRGGKCVEWLDPSIPDREDNPATVMLYHLDTWPGEALERLSSWRVGHPQVAVAATWRTDIASRAPLLVVEKNGLHGAEHVRLPALSARDDIVALGEAVAKQRGIWNGKLKQRLQYDMFTDVFPHNIHDLAAVLAMADSRSKGVHPERAAYVEASQLKDSAEIFGLLHEAYETLAGLKFGTGRPTLEQVLDVICAVTVRHAYTGGRTQLEVATLLGYSQTFVSEKLKQSIDLHHWRTRLEAGE